MKHFYYLRTKLVGALFGLLICSQSVTFGQVSLTSSGGTPTGSFTTVSDAFLAINAGTHTGNVVISIDGNTVEPATPTILAASGQGTTSYSTLLIKPTVVATISGATTAGSAVLNFDGSDNVTIDGSITLGGTTRDLTIQNTAANTVGNVACIRLIGRTTLGLGATNISIINCNVTGSTPGNNGLSGSTVTTTYGIYAGSTTATTMSSTTGGANYDNLLIQNNLITNAYFGVCVVGTTADMADNLTLIENTFGSTTNRIGFKGFVGQQLVGGNFTNNTVIGIQSTANVNIAGVEVGGTASNGFQIRRNTISQIEQFSANQYGAYGINVTNGTGIIVANNVISGVQAVNYASTSTVNNAHGIRITGGTNHGIYYNSINMFGAYTTPTTTYALSSAFTLTSTGVTGLVIRNNVFANKMTTNAPSGEFLALYFPTNYNFANVTLDNNAYMVTPDANHFVGKVGTTAGSGLYSNLTAWRTVSQVGNPTNDLNSVPGTGNADAPFTADNNLTIPAATVTVLESTGTPIASLGLPNVDRNNVARPAGTGSAPDMGAFEFEGTQPSDLTAPVVSNVIAAPGAQCTAIAHTVTADIVEDLAMGTVTLTYAYDGVAQPSITMTLTSGTPVNGTYSGTIPAASGANVTVTYSVQAVDNVGNTSSSVAGPSYADDYLIVTASADQTITTGTATTISATANNSSFGRLLISEVVQFKTGTGPGVYPTYIPTADNDYVEIANFGDVAADAGGYTITLFGGVNGTYTIPSGTIIPSAGVAVFAFSGTTSDPTNLYYGMGLSTTSSSVAMGYVLRDPQGSIKDAVASNGYTFTVASGVTATDWSGTIASASGLAGIRRTAATDNNVAADWTLSAATTNEMTIGVYNSEITIVPVPQTITWTTNFDANTYTSNPLSVPAFASPGAYTFYASYNDGTCTDVDSVLLTVVVPQTPVASFVATPLAGSAPLTVTFTDQSTNIPTMWSWTVAPMTGVTYTSGTSASSQNPVMQFANAGSYTITLTASNQVGSDDSTIVQYINVNYCGSGATNTADSDIGNVTFGALNNGTATPVLSNPGANGLYSDFTALPPATFGVGLTYPMSVSQITSGTTFYSAYVNVFIDFDNDGSFDPVSERVLSGPTSSTGPVSVVSGNVTIPAAAALGTVRMRVILNEGGTATSLPCGTFTYGETEDYVINISCTSVSPVADADTICAGGSTSFTASGNNIQWYADATTTTVLSTGATFVTPPLSSTTSYFATASDPGCVESARTEFVVLVNQPTSSTEIVSVCSDYVWPVDGMTYAATGMYTATIPNAAGCDSVITLDLTVLGSVTGTDVITSCDSLEWIDGNTYYADNNTATFMLTTTLGCDSLVTLNLTIVNSTSVTETASSCGDYVWAANGQTYNATGIYTATFVNAAGCDSVVTLDLTINVATTSTETVTSCGAYTWSADGNTYSAGGTYTAVLTNSVGCDSVATLVLTIASVSDLGVTVSGATLTADLGIQPGVSYNWLDCNANFSPITGATGASFSPTVNGNYAVRIVENGCVDTSACFIINNVGLDDLNKGTLSIVPNPTSNSVKITFDGSNAQLVILDLKGRAIDEMVIESGQVLDLSRYENGVYLFNIIGDSIKTIERVVKQ